MPVYFEAFVPNQALTQSVSMSTTSAQSAALNGGSALVQVNAACFVIRGKNPTATTACMPLVADVPYMMRGIAAGEKLAFIMASSTGTATITPQP